MRKAKSAQNSESSDWEDNDLLEDQKFLENPSLDVSVNSNVSKKRGRRKIPEQWSRVISLSTDDLTNLKVFELAPDLLLGGAM